MNAPIVWIAAPLVFSILLLLIPNQKWVSYLGSLFALSLTAMAYYFPADTALRLGDLSLKIDSTFTFYGRSISLNASPQVIIILAYGICTFWFFGTLATGSARRIIPLGLAIVALLVASLAVEPFLYAALLIELAILLSVPMLAEPAKNKIKGPGRGLISF